MKKLISIGFALALLTVSLFAASPVFFGSTTDYATNTGGTITFTFSNRTVVVFTRGSRAATFQGDVTVSGNMMTVGFQTNNNNVYFLTPTFYNDNLNLTSASILQDAGQTSTLATVTAKRIAAVTNGIGSVIGTATRTGGALTNITLNAQGPGIVHVDGSTNVNIVAMMNWAAGIQSPVTLLITNRTATVRTISFDAQTNNWIGMGAITGPISNTNAVWIAMENLGTSNVVYAAQYIANPTN